MKTLKEKHECNNSVWLVTCQLCCLTTAFREEEVINNHCCIRVTNMYVLLHCVSQWPAAVLRSASASAHKYLSVPSQQTFITVSKCGCMCVCMCECAQRSGNCRVSVSVYLCLHLYISLIIFQKWSQSHMWRLFNTHTLEFCLSR